MFLEVVKSEGLSHLSYVVGDAGEAAVIDPRRDSEAYLDIASRYEARITHVIETHRNEDYVVGSVEVARRTGAEVLHGPNMDWDYGRTVEEGFEIRLGNLRLRVLETPGHTFESLSVALADTGSSEDAVAVFTGDCLFVGDVGRTDLAGEGREREAAGMLYDSVFGKLLPLGDHVVLYPAHGAGSVCGTGMADREVSTLGYERIHNPALQVRSRDEFVERRLGERHDRPPYFRRMEHYNRVGAPLLDRLPRPIPVGPEELEARMQAGTVLVDVRSPEAWLGASIPGSIAIPKDMLASWAGWLLGYDHDVALVAEGPRDVAEAVAHLARLGFDRVTCHLAGGLPAWETAGRPLQTAGTLDTERVGELVGRDGELVWLDVRKAAELEQERLPGAVHVFLGELPRRLEEVPRRGPVVAFCGSGRRSTIAASILMRHGFDRVSVWMGSMRAARASGARFIS